MIPIIRMVSAALLAGVIGFGLSAAVSGQPTVDREGSIPGYPDSWRKPALPGRTGISPMKTGKSFTTWCSRAVSGIFSRSALPRVIPPSGWPGPPQKPEGRSRPSKSTGGGTKRRWPTSGRPAWPQPLTPAWATPTSWCPFFRDPLTSYSVTPTRIGMGRYFQDLKNKLTPNGCFAAHNVLWSGDPHIRKFLEQVKQAPGFRTTIERGSGEGISVSCRGAN